MNSKMNEESLLLTKHDSINSNSCPDQDNDEPMIIEVIEHTKETTKTGTDPLEANNNGFNEMDIDLTRESGNSTGGGGSSKRKKKKKSDPNTKTIQEDESKNNNRDTENPGIILKSVLSDSKFGRPNLSSIIMEKFEAPDYKHIVSKELSYITYEDTIHSVDITTSILPTEYAHYRVAVNPYVITNVCKVEPSNYPSRRRNNSKKQQQQQPPQQTQHQPQQQQKPVIGSNQRTSRRRRARH